MKKHTKLYALLLAAMLMAVSVLVPIYAQEETDDLVGYSPDRITAVDTTAIPDLKDVASELTADAYKITDVAGFTKLDDLIIAGVSFAEKTVYLANDVDFQGVFFEPIGYVTTDLVNDPPSKAFDGTFDGLGRKIVNLDCTLYESNKNNIHDFGGVAFFGSLSGATIKNFVIDDSCSFTYAADPHDHGCAAGIAMKTLNTSFDNCMNMADVDNMSRFTGGIVARWYGVGSITNCTNLGDLTGCQAVAGIVGYQQNAASTLTVENCRNVGDCTVTKQYGIDVAGLVGSNHSVAAIVGWSQSDLTLDGCINNGFIEGIDNVGGLVGEKSAGSLTVNNSSDYGYCNVNDAKEGGNYGAKAADDELWGYANVVVAQENNQVKRGETDPTLDPYLIAIGAKEVPNTTVIPVITGGTPTGPAPADTTATPTTATPTTATPTTVAPTTAAPTTATPTTATPTTATPTTVAPTTAAPTTATPTTAAPTTAAATTATPTVAATTEAPTAAATTAGDGTVAEESGCQSTVIGSMAIVLLVSGAAVTVLKKKED